MDSNTNITTTTYHPTPLFNSWQPAPVSPKVYCAIRRDDDLVTFHRIVSMPNQPPACYNLPTSSWGSAAGQTTILYHCMLHNSESTNKQTEGFRTIFVKNLEGNLSPSDLFHLFAPYGKIINYRLVVDKEGRSRRFGFVTFLHSKSALAAIADLNGKLIRLFGRLIVQPALRQWYHNIDKERSKKKVLCNRPITDIINSLRTLIDKIPA